MTSVECERNVWGGNVEWDLLFYIFRSKICTAFSANGRQYYKLNGKGADCCCLQAEKHQNIKKKQGPKMDDGKGKKGHTHTHVNIADWLDGQMNDDGMADGTNNIWTD